MATQVPLQDIQKKIPAKALSFIESFYEPQHVRLIHEAIRTKRTSSFRINPLKIDTPSAINQLRKEGIRFQEIPFIQYSFLLQSPEKDLIKTELYKNGALYLQGLSGMIPPLLLGPRQNETVLDLAASPGSKTTMLAALMSNSGQIHAIEPDFIRLQRLEHNCEILGVTNTDFFKANAEKFRPPTPDLLYDKILADVPCSGEGRFNLFDTSSYIFWKEKEISKFANLQYKILKAGIDLLKVGGKLVYSTCTLNPQENEDVIKKLLETYQGSLKTIPIKLSEVNIPEFKKVEQGKLHALRIIPSTRFEGFFICQIEKTKEIN
jgi:16S rRNA (cytosine1407-C5)-methyltransferase